MRTMLLMLRGNVVSIASLSLAACNTGVAPPGAPVPANGQQPAALIAPGLYEGDVVVTMRLADACGLIFDDTTLRRLTVAVDSAGEVLLDGEPIREGNTWTLDIGIATDTLTVRAVEDTPTGVQIMLDAVTVFSGDPPLELRGTGNLVLRPAGDQAMRISYTITMGSTAPASGCGNVIATNEWSGTLTL